MLALTPNIISIIIGVVILMSYGFTTFCFPHYHLEHKNNANGIEALINLDKISPKVLSNGLRYQLFNWTYILLLLLIYVLLREVWDPLMTHFFDFKEKNQVVKNITVAVLISGLLPYLPLTKNLINGSKSYLHHRAKIPDQARNIFAMLNGNPIKLTLLYSVASPAEQGMFKASFFNSSQLGQALSFPRIWLRYQYLYHEINKEKWQSLLVKNTCPESFSLERICLKHQQITEEINALHKNGTGDFSDIKIRVLKQLKNIYALITCSIINQNQSTNQAKKTIEALGFEIIREHNPRFDQINQFVTHTTKLLMVVLSCCLAFFVFKTLFPLQFQPVSFNNLTPLSAVGYWFLYSTFTLSTALFIAYYSNHLLKRHRLWQKIDFTHHYRHISERPWRIYITISVIAYLLISCALFFADYLADQAGHSQLPSLWAYFLWPIIPTLLTLFICYRFDTSGFSSNKKNSAKPLWQISIIQGTLLLLTSILILITLQNIPLQEKYNIADFIVILATNSLLGFFNSYIMGYFDFDRRNSPRYFSDTDNIALQLDPKNMGPNCQLTDISATGVKIQFPPLPQPLVNNQPLDFCYQKNNQRLYFHGKVIQAEASFARIKLEITENWTQALHQFKNSYHCKLTEIEAR